MSTLSATDTANMPTVYTHIGQNKFKSALLVLLTIIFALGIGAIFAYAADYGIVAIVIAGAIGIPGALIGYYAGDKIALAVNGARAVELENNRALYHLVDNVCITAGLPTPKIYIIPDPSPNAFATGRDPRRASIALTSGLLKLLEKRELEAVIAHELAHVGNYDTRYMTVVAILVGFVVMLSGFFRNFAWLGGGRRRSSRDQSGQILLLVGLLAAILAPIFAQLMRLAISRRRESLADAKGAEITRNPDALADSLIKIHRAGIPARFANDATAALYFADVGELEGTSFTARILSTHPPLEERVKALREMAS